jgi:hypothetical protein
MTISQSKPQPLSKYELELYFLNEQMQCRQGRKAEVLLR